MRKVLGFILSFVVISGISGCASQRPTQYIGSNEIIPGKPEQPTMYDLESSAQTLMQNMLTHQQFEANYKAAKVAKGKRLPIVVIGNIENKTSERIQGRLDALGTSIRSKLFSTGLFEVKDDEANGAITSRILQGANTGLEDGALVQFMGKHESPDFIVLGDIRHFTDVGGYHIYRLRLALHNLKTGKIVWEGIQTKVKL